ncbi:GNAT family N-acetyltransferase [Luteolibacter marinus]|uniref:GNAT family N-acetyltransferase n=1 Tax=Luteolibacter marinus TaxID=2776705 RepID=UPI001868DF35|nr:GNAT family N-acetyltransferase [Luteolibacter marinus]
MNSFSDNTSLERFERHEDGLLTFASYRKEGGLLVIPHVEVEPALRGTGAAGRLMADVLAFARAEGLKVRPLCGYAAAYMRRHPGTLDLLE